MTSLKTTGAEARSGVVVREAVSHALLTGVTHYTERAGIAASRAALAHALGRGRHLDSDRVIITASLEESLFIALSGLLPKGASVISATPGSDDDLLVSLGLNIRAVGADRSDALLLHADCSALQPWQARLIDAATAAGSLVILTEVLEDGASGSLAAAGVADGVVLVGDLRDQAFSRWGGGYVVGPTDLIEPMVELKQGLNICTAGHAQFATVAGVQQLAGFAGDADRASAELVTPAPFKPSARMHTAERSVSDAGTRQRYELLDLLAATPGAISLGRGDPDLPTPQPIVEAAISALEAPRLTDPDPLGLPDLRRAIAAKLAAENGVTVDPETEILVTTGGQEAIFLAVQALAGPGDEILMPGPRYTSYDVSVNVAGAQIVNVPPTGKLDFRLDLAAMESLIGPRTRALLIITPGNPTASVADRDRLVGLSELARRYGLTVISDEMYERIVYDGVKHTSIASMDGMRDLTVTVGGFSKAYAMTGWRVGYLAAPARLVEAASRLKRLWGGPTAEVSQYGALAALTHETDLAARAVATYASRRSIALQALDAMRLPYAPSEGAFYVFFDISSLGMHSYDFARGLLTDAGVFLYPGSGFGDEWSGYMRMAWLAPEDRLREALGRLHGWVNDNR